MNSLAFSSTAAWVYPMLMLLALGSCSLLLRRFQQQLPIQGWQKVALGIGGFCGAMIGSKLPFVVSDPRGMLDGTAWLAHGKTIMCGIVGGYFGVEIAKKLANVRIKTGDTFAIPVAVAVAVGRIGCFFGGCCYGKPCDLPWGVYFTTMGDGEPVVDVRRHPTQLYEAAFHLLLAVVLWQLLRRGILRGQLIKFYLLTYLCYRFVTEWLRPEVPLWLNLTGYQWAALALMPLFAWLWYRDARILAANEPVPVA
jgi:phosphatidylglycerol:prolipoprotein diacylglycerol transferase